MTERSKSYAYALTYPDFITAIISQSWNETTQKSNYVSTSAENGPAMAGPAGPVPAPVHSILYSCAMRDQHNQLTVVTRELIALKRGLNCVEFNMDNISEQDACDYRTELDWQLRDNWKWPGNEAKILPQLCTFTSSFHFPIRV